MPRIYSFGCVHASIRGEQFAGMSAWQFVRHWNEYDIYPDQSGHHYRRCDACFGCGAIPWPRIGYQRFAAPNFWRQNTSATVLLSSAFNEYVDKSLCA